MHHFFHHNASFLSSQVSLLSKKQHASEVLSTLHDAILRLPQTIREAATSESCDLDIALRTEDMITPSSIVRPEYEMDWNDDDPFDWTMITVDESESFVQTFLKKIPYIFNE